MGGRGRAAEEQMGRGREGERKDRGMGEENEHRPPTIFGLKVALLTAVETALRPGRPRPHSWSSVLCPQTSLVVTSRIFFPLMFPSVL